MSDPALVQIDSLIENTAERILEHERRVAALQKYPEQHRRAVELVLLYRDCLFELQETRKLLARIP